jgi:uncharacterized RDD family membrane protein YckC
VKKISEISVLKVINRKQRTGFGTYVFKKMYFEMKYNPSIENQVYRFWAKMIDLAIFVIPLHLLLDKYPMQFFDFSELGLSLLAGLLLETIYSAVLEHYFGATIGKYLAGVSVIDDSGNKPSMLKSLKRNLLSILNLSINTNQSNGGRADGLYTGGFFNMNYSNRKCGTYVVFRHKLKEIKELQHEERVTIAED